MRPPCLMASASPELAIGVLGVGPPVGVSPDFGRRLESGWLPAWSAMLGDQVDIWTCDLRPAGGSRDFVSQLDTLCGILHTTEDVSHRNERARQSDFASSAKLQL